MTPIFSLFFFGLGAGGFRGVIAEFVAIQMFPQSKETKTNYNILVSSFLVKNKIEDLWKGPQKWKGDVQTPMPTTE